jgi:hypothetical protein
MLSRPLEERKGGMAAANYRCRAATGGAAAAKLLYLIVDDDVDVVGLASHVCYRN